MSGLHSPVAPSSSDRRIQCSGSTLAEARYPEPEDGPDQKDGTAAHWGLAETLAGRLVDVGSVAPNGVFLTGEMVEAIDMTHADIERELKPYGMKPSDGAIEQPVVIPRIHPQAWGTPDYYVWVPPTRVLLYDFKFGRRFVDAFENSQCIEYLAGILAPVLARGVTDDQIDVTVKIAQPRSYNREGSIRSWSFVASDIRGHINRASNAAHEALGPSPTFRVGPECRDCKARHACPTLQRASMAACDVAGKAQPFDLPPEAMALEYRTLLHYKALLKARAAGLEQQLLALGRQGARLPGLAIENGAGRQRWTLPDAAVIQIGQALGVQIAKPAEVMTPKQAVAAGLPEAVLAGIVNQPRGEAKLVLDDGSAARKVFA